MLLAGMPLFFSVRLSLYFFVHALIVYDDIACCGNFGGLELMYSRTSPLFVRLLLQNHSGMYKRYHVRPLQNTYIAKSHQYFETHRLFNS